MLTYFGRNKTSNNSKKVAIVVPLSRRAYLTPEEQISLRHLCHYLGKYDKYMVAPYDLEVDFDGFRIKRFRTKYFGSVAAHCKLMLSTHFYEAFREYRYILIYHLDSLVFSDQLEQWCARDFDYIGPPWLPCPDTPWVKVPRTGNGGFSLRKVDSFLQVLRSRAYSIDPRQYGAAVGKGGPWSKRILRFPKKWLKYLRVFNGVRWEIAHWQRNEDQFWSERAQAYYPAFTIPPVEISLRFAFEAAPRRCFELNNRQLPFGCHAWHKYDRAFWEPYLLR